MSLEFDLEHLHEDEPFDLKVVERKDLFPIHSEDADLSHDVDLACQIRRVGNMILLSGKVDTELRLVCSRCLEPFQFQVHTDVSACFMKEPESQTLPAEQELHSADIDVEFYTENKINLAQPVYDQIMLNLPFVRLCRDDCKGLCSQCGVNRNETECGCEQEGAIDPRLEVLKSLKDKIK